MVSSCSSPMGFLKSCPTSLQIWSSLSHSSAWRYWSKCTWKESYLPSSIRASKSMLGFKTLIEFPFVWSCTMYNVHSQKKMKMRLVVAECWTTKHYCCNRVRAIALSPLPVERPQNYSFHDIAVRGGGLADHDQGMMMMLLPCLRIINIFSFNILFLVVSGKDSETKSQAFNCRCLKWQL